MFRTVGDAADVRKAMAPLEGRVSIEHVLEVPPIKMKVVPGFETAVFPYTTDIPFLAAWGQPLLFGPGSILVAHTAYEFVPIPELHTAVDSYVGIARALLRPVGDCFGYNTTVVHGSGGTSESSGTAVLAVFIIIERNE